MNTQYGRSMVEMLGVLAIVGVLSVGAIAGYSKAMMKYKMNKFSLSINELLNTCIQYSGKLNSASNSTNGYGAQYFAKILYKMHALPDGIKYVNDQFLEDMFGNSIWPYSYPDLYGLGYNFGYSGNNELSSEICRQLIITAKENSSQLSYISADIAPSGENYIPIGQYSGDAYCSKNIKCIKNMTISDIDTMCHTCQQNNGCLFYFVWK